MSMHQAPESFRTRIAIFGRTNAGKSSLINAITGQGASIVSDQPGTTTDPVKRSMELLPLGPVTLIDTAGLDDQTPLGQLRMQRSLKELSAANIVLFVCDANLSPSESERGFLSTLRGKPTIIAANKCDLGQHTLPLWKRESERLNAPCLVVSADKSTNIEALKAAIAAALPESEAHGLVRDLVPPGKCCVLVVPIDAGAPKGRLILPQQQVIRDLLEGGSMPIVCRDSEYPAVLGQLRALPALVVTDSQVFPAVAKDTPNSVPLTSFSILFARFKGELSTLSEGAKTIPQLQDGDEVLISEGCTHHRQCDDIGTKKIPALLQAHTGKQLRFSFTSGGTFTDVPSRYRLIVHCGACMLTESQMKVRIAQTENHRVPIVNYGILIAQLNGILPRALAPFGL